MGPELLELHPQELTFVFELKKQSSDSIQLSNSSDQYIAFKVKTTSPKKYCVRPNIGIIKPKSTSVFTVTMQAQREAPPYMQCKDKFLVQSTIVPYGTKEEEISSELFAKNSGKYIEEKKLRVVLTSPSPRDIPVNGNSDYGSSEKSPKQDHHFPTGLNKPLSELIYKDEDPEYSTDIKTSVLKLEEAVMGLSSRKNGETTVGTKIDYATYDTMNMDTTVVNETVNANYMPATMDNLNVLTIPHKNAASEKLKDLWTKPQTVESRPTGEEDISAKEESMQFVPDVNVREPKIEKTLTNTNSKDNVEVLRSKLITMTMHLDESEKTITKLGEEQSKATKEIEMLKQELALLRQRSNSDVGQIYDGFPFLFVVVVALVSLLGGYLLRP